MIWVVPGRVVCRSSDAAPESSVRRRTWIRTGVHVAYGSPEETRSHLLSLTTRLAQVEEEKTNISELSTKLADELTTQKQLVSEYEEKIRELQHSMAYAAATGA